MTTRRLNARQRSAAVTGALVVLSTLLTALLALVVEDALPRDGVAAELGPMRVVPALLVLGVVVGLLVYRARLADTRGTLFHVHLLDENMRDQRRDALDSAAARNLGVRSVVRWVDVTRESSGVIDVIESCREVGVALEANMNDDRDDTGYTVAPNMLWPTALAVGAYLPPVRSLTLLELPGKRNAGEVEYPLFRGDGNAALPEPVPTGVAGGDRVGAWLAITGSAAHADEALFARFGVGEVYRLARDGVTPGDPGTFDDLGAEELSPLSARLAAQLVAVKQKNPQRELVVVAMITKTLALALGWHLAQAPCRFFAGTHLMWFDETLAVYVPMRVRPSSPTHPPIPESTDDDILINLTPHPVVVLTSAGEVTVAVGGAPARVRDRSMGARSIGIHGVDVDVHHVEQGAVQMLPEPRDGVSLIVSRPVALACPAREDLLVPYDELRDELGRVNACRGLARLASGEGD